MPNKHRHGDRQHDHGGGGRAHTHAAGAQAERPLPQTGQGGKSFQSASRKAARPAYAQATTFGATIDTPLAATPGYTRWLDITVAGTGGSGASATAGKGDSAISPAGVIQFIQVKDAFGTPLISGGGLEIAYLSQIYGGQVGIMGAADPRKWPDFSDFGALAGNAGNFSYHFRLPFEITPTYGLVAMGNASLQPSLHIQFAAASAVYNTVPANVVPALQLTVDEAYWPVPTGEHDAKEPPGLGTTLQWTQLTANPTIGSGSSQRVQFPRVAGYITTVILLARDSTGAVRDDVWPAGASNKTVQTFGVNNRVRLYLDGVPVLDESFDERTTEMFIGNGGFYGSANGGTGFNNRVSGVLVYDFKRSESQVNLGQLDSLETVMSTNPGTLIEVECTPWGAYSTNAPATLTAIVGAIVPRRQLQRGLIQ